MHLFKEMKQDAPRVCQSNGGASVNCFVPDSISTKLSAESWWKGVSVSEVPIHREGHWKLEALERQGGDCSNGHTTATK